MLNTAFGLALAGVAGLLLVGCGGGSSTVAAPTPAPTPAPAPAACSVPSVSITHSAAALPAPQLIFLDTTKYPQAVCNDGSPGAYLLQPGAGTAAGRWVITLGGGGACYDQASCASRAGGSPGLISSNPYRSAGQGSLALGGLLSTNASVNPDFFDATTVGILYCSSDYWSGATSASGAFEAGQTSTWNFSGRAILSAVIDDLTKNHGLSSASEVLFTGESAGGLGVFLTVNDVAPLFGSSTRFVAASDAGYAIDVAAFDPQSAPPNYTSTAATTGVEAAAALGHALWGGRGDRLCSAAAKPGDPVINCYAPHLLLESGVVSQPVFMQQAQMDPVQLTNNGIYSGDLSAGALTPAESGYTAWFAGQMRAALDSGVGRASVFSPDALVHAEASEDTLFNTTYSFPLGAISDRAALGTWYRDPCTTHAWIAP